MLLRGKTKLELQKLAKLRTVPLKLVPGSIHGIPMEKIRAAASSGSYDGGDRNRIVYLSVNDDCSAGKVGEGKLERLWTHLAAALMRSTPAVDWKGPRDWPIGQPFYEMLVNNQLQAKYIVLANGLSKQQSRKGEGAVYDLMGVAGMGGWLVNVMRG
jgi:hypothetical protein